MSGSRPSTRQVDFSQTDMVIVDNHQAGGVGTKRPPEASVALPGSYPFLLLEVDTHTGFVVGARAATYLEPRSNGQ